MVPASGDRRVFIRRLTRRVGGGLACLLGLLLLATGDDRPSLAAHFQNLSAQDAAAEAPSDVTPSVENPAVTEGTSNQPVGRLIRVPLPLKGNADTHVISIIQRALADLPKSKERPILVLEFSSGNQNGRGSDFERSLKLARFLSGRELAGVKTVAFLPHSLQGHAVLPAMACEEIVMAPDAEFGQAGLDEPAEEAADPTVRSGYREIANRRRTVPAEVALAMLDKNLEVLKVETEVSPEFVLREDLEALKKRHTIQSEQVLSRPGQFAEFTGREARELGFVKFLAADRAALAKALSLPAAELEDDPSLAGDWRAVRITLDGPITSVSVNRVRRTIEKQVRDHHVNFICLWINCPGGSLVESMNLVSFLAEQDPGQVRIVAYVPTKAGADAALIALAADQLVMNRDAELGGTTEVSFDNDELQAAEETLRTAIAPLTTHRWSLAAALIDPRMRVFKYTNKDDGEVGYFSPDEAAEQSTPADWVRGDEVTRPGQGLMVTGEQAVELGLARHAVQDFSGFKHLYGLSDEMSLAEMGWADYLIEALAAPAVAWVLLLIGGAALYAELHSPGIGIGAFIAGIAFLLYFWSRHLEGTAGWLEVLLFAAGVCCVLLELFVLPGAAIFGLGGGLLILTSIILASQTFVIPHDEHQIAQLRDSLLSLFGVFVCIAALAVLMHRYLPHSPLFSNMMLDPPSDAELADISHRESLVDFDHLFGCEGVAATQLTPSGKARFGNELVDVIAEGEAIDRGAQVVVSEVHGNRVVVRLAAGRA